MFRGHEFWEYAKTGFTTEEIAEMFGFLLSEVRAQTWWWYCINKSHWKVIGETVRPEHPLNGA